MKKCDVCGENFEDKYAFCPLDEMPLLIALLPLGEGQGMRGVRRRRQALSPTLSQRVSEFDREVTASATREFNLTLIDDARLPQRLAIEIQFVVDQIKRAWPSFKSHPVAFTRSELGELTKRMKQTVARPHVVSGALTAMLVLSALVLSVLVLEKHSPKRTNKTQSEDLTRLVTINFPQEPAPTSDKGVGTGEKGRVGFESGKGEGSAPRPARSQGGGGSGDRDPNPSSQGRVPTPSVIPAPISTTYARLPRSLPDAGIDIDPVLWKDLRYPNYGDPRSKSTTPSNGSGEGGGVGTGKGTGIGEGEDNGFGPGRKGNIGGNDNSAGCCGKGGSSGNNPNPNEADRVYNPHDVTQRARVLFKPEPQYTEEARKNSITGTVILRVVFSKTGEVTNIRAMQSLQGGLTEKAIAAARQIRFVPATRNGQPVSMYMQLEYNFNLY